MINRILEFYTIASQHNIYDSLGICFAYLLTLFINNPRVLVTLIGYLLMILGFRYLKNVLIKYPGDVAVYVTSHKLNKFYEIREQIKKEASDIARAVYYSVDPNNNFVYDNIICSWSFFRVGNSI